MKIIRHSIDILLVALAAVGVYLTLVSTLERNNLQAEVARLEAKVGIFENIDRDKINILALETGKPLEFAWRIYLPPNYPLYLTQISSNGGSSGSSSTSVNSLEFIARVKISEQDGKVQFKSRFANSFSTQQMHMPSDWSKAGFDAHRNDFVIQQLGKNKMATLGIDEEFDLLDVRLPGEDPKSDEKSSSESFFRIQLSKNNP